MHVAACVTQGVDAIIMVAYGLFQHVKTHLAEKKEADKQKCSILYRVIVSCGCVDN